MTRLEIEAFLTIIKSGSISAAAEQLFVTQPALSRRIRALEQELGYELFIRNKGVRAVSLTEEGTAFASVGSVSTYLLPNILRQIISVENSYNLCFHNYHSYESYGHVESGMVDIALISDDMYHKTVITTPAFQEPFLLIGGEASAPFSVHSGICTYFSLQPVRQPSSPLR